MNRIGHYIILLLVLIVQSTLVDLISVGGYKPDLALVFFLLMFARKGGFSAVFAGFGIGLAQDLLGGGILGLNALSKAAAGYLLAKLFPEKIPDERWLYWGGLTLTVLVHDLIYWYIAGQTEYLGIGQLIYLQVLPQFVYNTFLVLLSAFLFSESRR